MLGFLVNKVAGLQAAITLKFPQKSKKQKGNIKIRLIKVFALASVTMSSSLAKCYLFCSLIKIKKIKKTCLYSCKYYSEYPTPNSWEPYSECSTHYKWVPYSECPNEYKCALLCIDSIRSLAS